MPRLILHVRFVAVLAALFAGPTAAEQSTYIVDFRDGTVLRVQIPDVTLPWRRVSEIGEISERPVQLSAVEQLRFVLTPATQQVDQIRRHVEQLGSDSFQKREVAQDRLIRQGAKFRKLLELTLPRTDDFEVRWRLREVLNILPDEEGFWSSDYDQLRIRENDEELRGDAGSWSVTVSYRGRDVTIDRENVLSIRNAPLDFDLLAEPPVAHIERIARDDDGLFPEDVVRIDFDHGPQGETIAPGTDIAETYSSLGCTFSTSFVNSYVAIEPYNVGGRSGKNCAANHEPLYEGVMTIRFCKPGNARLPAGVRYVGFWTSHVVPDGTALECYDARDRLIGEIKTVTTPRDFLALTSNSPIAYVRVVPTEADDETGDPDFAIDDLVFDRPVPLSESGDPDRYSVVLKSGERLHGTAMEKTDTHVFLRNLTIGVDQLELPVGELAVLVPPRMPLGRSDEPTRGFVRLADGSVLRTSDGKGLVLHRFADLPVEKSQLVALWGAETILQEPAAENWPEEAAVVISGDTEQSTALKTWALGDQWIESAELSPGVARTYVNSPVVWFQKPSKRSVSSGLVRTTSGEEIVVSKEGGFFELRSWSLDGATIAHGNREWTIGLDEIRSLLLPKSADR